MRAGIDLRHDLDAVPNCRRPIGLEQGRGFDRVSLKSWARSAVWNIRQEDGGYHRNDRHGANHFEKGKTFFCVRTASHCLP
jgi:hypothetical protein